MYKAGDKFIIEIEEVFTGKATGYPQYRIKGFDKLVMDDRGLVKLRKYEDKQDAEIKVGDEVSVMQKYGKWIEHPEIETSAPEYLMFYECSECGNKPCFCKSDIHKKRFCSNCGAKMVEPQESEDKE